ncbi:hypothetical protein SARC_00136 [Sphaeroforma arctica JP610]|uniref:PAS domain-containing protein n=1 Tax=Sphaeroforma arctica JP610 TaxID=667725 RepID=A0A0L0GFY2_9EUKA|nr:hypothetical protein SARC_00136 [Sphaeroforma arctica JP610]KNC87764.1 hypothetical protein SARC_00136 [Sphaeroforma arctica JP610]|eukprot:XP_014161666.1 hypothetical protein SARC_00136 [Sphaeroforma arctica JP610]
MVLDDAIEIDDAIGKSNDIDVADAKDPDVKSIQSRKTTRTNNTNVSEGEGSLLDTVQNSILSLMAMDCFPRFLVSKYGNNYIRSLAVRNEGNDDEFINQLNAFQAKAKSVSKSDPTQAWLTKFICMAYMLPFSVTISTRVKDPGPEGTFPLSFVNPEFTRVTGYTHDETVGRNCRFLQGPKTEPEAVEKLRVGIRDGTKIHTSITNYCKDGEEFTNLLTLHPVFDKKGVHQFVVGVQYDISDLTVSKIASLSTILDFLSEKMEV